MVSRNRLTLLCVAVVAIAAKSTHAQALWVDVANSTHNQDYVEEVERRYTPELVEEYLSAKADALLLYTEYTAQAGNDLKGFLKNISGYADDALNSLDRRYINDSSECRSNFDNRLRKIENDAHRAASFSGENHHKFLLGHMIVFRMHLNKSEDYINKCDRLIRGCGGKCETTPRVKRWRRLAAEEIHRVRDDLQHSRRSYKDLITHARRRLNHIRRQVSTRAKDAVQDYHKCVTARG